MQKPWEGGEGECYLEFRMLFRNIIYLYQRCFSNLSTRGCYRLIGLPSIEIQNRIDTNFCYLCCSSLNLSPKNKYTLQYIQNVVVRSKLHFSLVILARTFSFDVWTLDWLIRGCIIYGLSKMSKTTTFGNLNFRK